MNNNGLHDLTQLCYLHQLEVAQLKGNEVHDFEGTGNGFTLTCKNGVYVIAVLPIGMRENMCVNHVVYTQLL